ncbi:ATP synthase F0 subunit A [Candidatus Saganbacteria bacterium CG08_land_8_20_14_0_20_45_16]|uniref:ATP synthase subunit a n=1 Tax=Candidatus Saganbacteria bacterium CG08_land_8_20_14_0_20_45_16 TaxID=2014293 RepID=A0A2H0Y1D0_UNCSA|nr:MAG: ATP synthase F0 subunit A [Candidatus Saganbacteria bacterium CG08_land_8_20_14_0_20_45_16]
MGLEIGSVRLIWQLSCFGQDISITSAVIVIWLVALLVFGLCYLAVWRAKVVPGKSQSLLEILYEFWFDQTKDLFEAETDHWLPFIFGLFLFILVANLLAMVPNVYPITANINTTATLALIVFFTYHFAGIRKNGLWHYFRSFVPSGMPLFILPFLVLIEIGSHLARPFSLAVRLFANMTAGHLVTFTLLSLIFVFKNIWLTGFPLLGRAAVGLFEVFVAFIQAYVFAYLAALYISLAASEEA